jgi:AraC-like DNA-binding protein
MLELSEKLNSFKMTEISYAPDDLKAILKIQQLIEAHFKTHRNKAFYCEKMGLSLFQINNITRYYLEKSLYRLLQDRLLLEASRLIQLNELSIKEIAHKLGIYDQATLCNFIKRQTGMTPKELRWKYQAGKEIAVCSSGNE